MSQEQNPQNLNAPIEIKNIKQFIDGISTFSKGDLRVILLDQQNRMIYIPLAEFSSEGGSQTLEEVLIQGNTANKDNSSVGFLNGSGDGIQSYMNSGNSLTAEEQFFSEVQITPNVGSLGTYWAEGANESIIKTGANVTMELKRGLARTTFTITPPIVDTTLFLPALINPGNYTLATTNDLNLQQIITNSANESGFNSAYAELQSLDGGSVYFEFTAGEEGNSFINLKSSEGDIKSYISIYTDYLILTSDDVVSGKGVTYLKIEPQITEGIEATFQLPINKTISGNYIIALEPKTYTVETLPVGGLGDRAYVTNALAPTYLSPIVGGGSVVTPVFHNGTEWVAN